MKLISPSIEEQPSQEACSNLERYDLTQVVNTRDPCQAETLVLMKLRMTIIETEVEILGLTVTGLGIPQTEPWMIHHQTARLMMRVTVATTVTDVRGDTDVRTPVDVDGGPRVDAQGVVITNFEKLVIGIVTTGNTLLVSRSTCETYTSVIID
jgi:hypothetical protein